MGKGENGRNTERRENKRKVEKASENVKCLQSKGQRRTKEQRLTWRKMRSECRRFRDEQGGNEEQGWICAMYKVGYICVFNS